MSRDCEGKARKAGKINESRQLSNVPKNERRSMPLRKAPRTFPHNSRRCTRFQTPHTSSTLFADRQQARASQPSSRRKVVATEDRHRPLRSESYQGHQARKTIREAGTDSMRQRRQPGRRTTPYGKRVKAVSTRRRSCIRPSLNGGGNHPVIPLAERRARCSRGALFA